MFVIRFGARGRTWRKDGNQTTLADINQDANPSFYRCRLI